MNARPQSVGRVIAAHRRLLRLRTPDGREVVARLARRELSVVCGDHVRCELDTQHDELRVIGLERRASALYRTNARGGGELIAANLSLLLVVVAPLPAPDFFIVDRYLAAARSSAIQAVVVLNKCELPMPVQIEQELADLAVLGYRCLRVSAHEAAGVLELRALLRDQTAMLVGQSGVGKSSLLGALSPQVQVVVGALIRDDEGRHTTTAAQLYTLADGGEIIDSPGVRDFAPALDRLDAAALGFVEIETAASGCRFADCRHMREPDCAVRAAVGSTISARRYESYRRLRRLYERLGAEH